MAPSSGAAVIDATGARDSFKAGYIAAQSTDNDVPAAFGYAHRVASICIATSARSRPRMLSVKPDKLICRRSQTRRTPFLKRR
jgi:sugar/nucleoside kinase (ribokinase family)